MKKPVSTLIAGLALAAAAAAGTLATATESEAAPQADTAWGTPPVHTPDLGDAPVVTPLDTAWG